MTKELMQLEVDSDLKKAFLACVSRAYNGKVEEGILDLMRIYVERAKGTPGQKMIKEKVKEYVYGGEVQAGLSPREMEKIFSIRQKRTSKLHASISKILKKK